MIRRKHFLYFLTSLGHCLYFLCVFCSFFSFHKTSQVIELKNMAVYFPGFKDYRDGSDYDQIAYDWVSAHKDELQGKRVCFNNIIITCNNFYECLDSFRWLWARTNWFTYHQRSVPHHMYVLISFYNNNNALLTPH